MRLPLAMRTAAACAVSRVKELLDNAWIPYLAFMALANFASPEISYLQLALYSAYALSSSNAQRGRVSSVFSLPIFALVQIPLIVANPRSQPSMLALLSTSVAAVIEEMYYRGVLQPKLGIVPQAFAFALAHVRLTDPVSLVESALLVPHYMLLGIAFGIVADQGGYLSSAPAHAIYNLVSATYTLPFDVSTVIVLLTLDALLVLTLVLQRLRRQVE